MKYNRTTDRQKSMDVEQLTKKLKRCYLHFACAGYLREHEINPTHVCQIVAQYVGSIANPKPEYMCLGVGDFEFYDKNVSSKVKRMKDENVSEIIHMSYLANCGLKWFKLSRNGEYLFAVNDKNELCFSNVNKKKNSNQDILYSVKLLNDKKSLQFVPIFTNGKCNSNETYWNGKEWIEIPISNYDIFDNGNTIIILVNYTNDKQDLYGVGYYTNGEFGLAKQDVYSLNRTRWHEDVQYVSYPKQITCFQDLLDEKIETIAIGKKHTIFLTKQGNCYGCGNNKFGQCGSLNENKINNNNNNNGELKESEKGLTAKEKNTIYMAQKLDFKNNVKMTKVVCGDYHTLCFEKEKNNLWVFGMCISEKESSKEKPDVGIFEPLLLKKGKVEIVDIEANKHYTMIMDATSTISIVSQFKPNGEMIIASQVKPKQYVPYFNLKSFDISGNNNGFTVYSRYLDSAFNVDRVAFNSIFNVTIDDQTLEMKTSKLMSQNDCEIKWNFKKYGKILSVMSRGNVVVFFSIL